MKTLVFQDSSGLQIEFLTDLIGNNKQFTVYQIQERDADGIMRIGLSDTSIAAGWDFGVKEYHLGEMIAWATSADCTLTAVETGKEDDVLYQGTYYGGAIGIELLE